MSECRKQPRALTLKTGRILVNNQLWAIDCAVLNISDDGACVLVESAAEIPDAFVMITDHDGMNRACTVAWKAKPIISAQRQNRFVTHDCAGPALGEP